MANFLKDPFWEDKPCNEPFVVHTEVHRLSCTGEMPEFEVSDEVLAKITAALMWSEMSGGPLRCERVVDHCCYVLTLLS